jgi:hypothetical protein
VSTVKVNAITDASGGNTATINSMTPTADSLQGQRNRIINGDMRIDQRNAGASAAINGNNVYTLDRWGAQDATDGAFTVQQDSSAPARFTKSLKVTVTTADASLGATQVAQIYQNVEGFNFADLGWGTASAQTVTLSFWVRSSLTGTFGGCFSNDGNNRSYPFTYAISAADTWEQKTITVAGDTTGTWLTTNAIGLRIYFGLGAGSTYSGTAGSWSGSLFLTATGATSVIGTLNATWYITGVQLEVGSVATPFERRDYGRELILCQRYFVKETGYNAKIASRYGASLVYLSYTTPVEMRTTPTVANSATNWQVLNTTASENSTTSTVNTVLSYVGGNVDVVLNTSFNPAAYIYIATSSGNNSLTFSSEL